MKSNDIQIYKMKSRAPYFLSVKENNWDHTRVNITHIYRSWNYNFIVMPFKCYFIQQVNGWFWNVNCRSFDIFNLLILTFFLFSSMVNEIFIVKSNVYNEKLVLLLFTYMSFQCLMCVRHHLLYRQEPLWQCMEYLAAGSWEWHSWYSQGLVPKDFNKTQSIKFENGKGANPIDTNWKYHLQVIARSYEDFSLCLPVSPTSTST